MHDYMRVKIKPQNNMNMNTKITEKAIMHMKEMWQNQAVEI